MMILLFSGTLLVSATLLFFVQPMVGKMLLPMLGGTPSVWNTCMVFFQALLLAGYSYAHYSVKFLGLRRQTLIHVFILFLPLLSLPIVFSDDALPTQSNPIGWLLQQLLVYVGLPFFVVSSSAPLLQKWFSALDHPDSEDPYFLYSASNFGSLVALLAYPLVIEPTLDVQTQSRFWMYGYVLLILLTASCAYWVKKSSKTGLTQAPQAGNQSPVTSHDRILWICAAMIPSSLMLGVTTSLTTDIAAVPLLWVIPLAIYLLTFTLVFAKHPPVPHELMVRLLPFAALLLTPFLFSYSVLDVGDLSGLLLPLHFAVFFIAAMVCHGLLANNRPSADHLTEFYLWISVGGVVGGILNAIIAPLVFSSLLEYPIMLIFACALPAFNKNRPDKLQRNDLLIPLIIVIGGLGLHRLFLNLNLESGPLAGLPVLLIPILICLKYRRKPLRFAISLAAVMLIFHTTLITFYDNTLIVNRNFFGVKRVVNSDSRQLHMFIHGGTTHGYQSTIPERRHTPMAYYHRSGPIGDVFAEIASRNSASPIGIIGLGCGGMAAYAEPGQVFDFYEIDPMIDRIAKNPEYFSYLADCQGICRTFLGDGRLSLKSVPDKSYAVIILDAFSSDSIPTHLVTREAIQLYLRKLKQDGFIVFNATNRFVDITRLLGNLAADANLVAYIRSDLKISKQEFLSGKTGSQYVVMAHQTDHLGHIADNPEWTRLLPGAKPAIWTDRFSNILGIITW